MGFDILAMEPTATTDEGFREWWARQAEWAESFDYDDPSHATAAIRMFFQDLAETFPPMNGPLAPSDERVDADPDLENRLTDYSIGRTFVFADFGFALESDRLGDLAQQRFLQLAYRHGLAIVLTTGDLEILRPDRDPLPDWAFARQD